MEVEQCNALIIGEYPLVPLIEKKNLVYHSKGSVTNLQATLKIHVNQDSPTMSNECQVTGKGPGLDLAILTPCFTDRFEINGHWFQSEISEQL